MHQFAAAWMRALLPILWQAVTEVSIVDLFPLEAPLQADGPIPSFEMLFQDGGATVKDPGCCPRSLS
jgi:hypothetical protein